MTAAWPLIDGGLHAGEKHRRELVERMAADLVRFDAWRNPQDATRSLFGRYGYTSIALLLDDARQVAMQTAVAREMSQP